MVFNPLDGKPSEVMQESDIGEQTRTPDVNQQTIMSKQQVGNQSEEPELFKAAPQNPSERQDYFHDVNSFFDEDEVRGIVRRLSLDDGGIVIDSYAIKLLKYSFIELSQLNNPMAINRLQDVIHSELPGMAGEQVSHIVKRYYEYRLVEDEMISRNDNLFDQVSAFNFEQLVQLRRTYLGHEVADKLYAKEEMLTRDTLALIELETDASLSEAQKSKKRQILESHLEQRLAAFKNDISLSPVRDDANREDKQITSTTDSPQQSASSIVLEKDSDWKARFTNYWEERHNVIIAGLTEQDKLKQIKQLQKKYFSEEEMEQVRIKELQLKIKESLLDSAN
jgi:hypothetical protein